MEKNQEFTVSIEDISEDGAGIGKLDGYIWFIKDAVIGDVVRARAMKMKKNYGFARLMEILTLSEARVEPKCPVARQCGGCQLQETFPRNLFHDSVLLLTVSWYRVILVMMDGNGHSPIGSLGLLYFRCTRKNAEKIPTLQKEKDAPQAERGCCASLILSRRTYMESLYLIL